jgi:hypothetical protein
VLSVESGGLLLAISVRFKALLALVYMFEEINDILGVRAEFRYVIIPEKPSCPSSFPTRATRN